MEELDMNLSNALLEMAAMSLGMLERVNIPDEIQSEIEDIKSEILSDD
jgi:hypothetical protein